jgi:hypothetical protein
VRIAAAEVNGDGRAEIIAGSGPGDVCQTTIFDPLTMAHLADFVSFEPTFTGGTYTFALDGYLDPANHRTMAVTFFNLRRATGTGLSH